MLGAFSVNQTTFFVSPLALPVEHVSTVLQLGSDQIHAFLFVAQAFLAIAAFEGQRCVFQL